VEEGTASTTGRISYRDYSLHTWVCCPVRRWGRPLPTTGRISYRDYILCIWACYPVRWRREQPLPQTDILQGLHPLYLGLLSCEVEEQSLPQTDILQGLNPLYMGLLSCEVEEGTASTKGRIFYRAFSLCTWACCPVRWRREQPLPQAGYSTGTKSSVPGLAVL
jgi:hypothetical protein